MTNVSHVDLNLLRLFDAVYRHRNISRAATEVGLSQPSASQGITRLRLILGDPLFERAGAGVRPTARANRLARSVQAGLTLLESGLSDESSFIPSTSRARMKIHLTDIGEARFLPRLMEAMTTMAPHMQVEAVLWPIDGVPSALHAGQLDFAIGFLPEIEGTAAFELVADRYMLLLRSAHPLAREAQHSPPDISRLETLDFIAVRTHGATLKMFQKLNLEHRIRLMASSFLSLPAIVRCTDLAVLMPAQVARSFEPAADFAVVDTGLPEVEFKVSVHWSRRSEQSASHRWMLGLLRSLFEECGTGGHAAQDAAKVP